MWSIPAQTPEGRRAKLLVLLGDIMTDGWSEHDGNVDWDIKMARDLMIEFVGGEPGEQLRDQFSVARHSKPACVQSVRRRVYASSVRSISTIPRGPKGDGQTRRVFP